MTSDSAGQRYVPPPPAKPGLRSESTDFAQAARASMDALKSPDATQVERSEKGATMLRKHKETFAGDR